MIRFFIKSAFWLSLAFIVMPRIFGPLADNATTPSAPSASNRSVAANNKVTNQDNQLASLVSAGKSVAEIGSFCIKNAELCETGRSALATVGTEALKGSGTVLDYLSQKFGEAGPAASVANTVKSNHSPVTAAIAAVGQTMQASAIPIPTWRAEALQQIDRTMTSTVLPR